MPIPVPAIIAIVNMLPKLFKSKTMGGNALVGAVITILSHFGIDMSVEVVTAMFVVANALLRMITKKPLSEK